MTNPRVLLAVVLGTLLLLLPAQKPATAMRFDRPRLATAPPPHKQSLWGPRPAGRYGRGFDYRQRAPALLVAPPSYRAMLTLDPARTQIRFTISDTMHTIHGTFVMKSGEVRYDPASGAAGGDIVIDAASGDSGNHTRDSRMKKSVLQVAQFPEVHFLPRHILGRVPSQKTGHFQVQGICRLHGTEHPLTLDITGTINGTGFSGTTRFSIPYVQWGLKDPSTFFLRVSKQVIIDVTTTGTLSRPQT